MIQTCPGTTRLGLVKIGGFVRSPHLRKPRIPVATKKTRNAIWSWVHKISPRDHFPDPFVEQKHVCAMSRL